MRFRDKVVLLTGAGGGIGTAAAGKFVSEGAKVALFDVDQNAVRRLAADLGPAATYYVCDVSDETSFVGAIAASLRELGRIDLGVLNAGISGKRQALQDIDVAAFDTLMGVNVRGVFLGLKHLFPIMRDQGGGSIVVTSSTEGLRGNGGLAPTLRANTPSSVWRARRPLSGLRTTFGSTVSTLRPSTRRCCDRSKKA